MNENGLGWFPQVQPQQGKNIFTAFIDSEDSVRTYPVPAGAMVILIRLAGKDSKMFFKSTDPHGVPLQTRVFELKEVAIPTANTGFATQEEVGDLSKKVDDLSDSVKKLVAAFEAKGEAK